MFQGCCQTACKWALLSQDESGRHVFRIAVDRVSEQEQLDDGYPNDHGECESIPFELEEFLDDDAPPAGERKKTVFVLHGVIS